MPNLESVFKFSFACSLSSILYCWLFSPFCGIVLSCSVLPYIPGFASTFLGHWDFFFVFVFGGLFCGLFFFFTRFPSFASSSILAFFGALSLLFFTSHFPPRLLMHVYVFVEHFYLNISQDFTPEFWMLMCVWWISSLRYLEGTQTDYV